MSHWTSIQTEIRDIDALRAACDELGLTLRENAQARGYENNTRHGDYVVQLKGPFDVALTREQNGNYSLATDWWDGHVEKEVGTGYGRLLQLYGVHKASLEARKRGLTVQRRLLQNGTINLRLGRV
jgi:hypothetical protein